jgi:hypothetical protein
MSNMIQVKSINHCRKPLDRIDVMQPATQFSVAKQTARGPKPINTWDDEFESRLRHGRLYATFCLVLKVRKRRPCHSSGG